MTAQSHVLEILPASFAICRFSSDAPLPAWCDTLPFCSISRTDDELSIICAEHAVPNSVTCSRGWTALKVRGPFTFDAIGVLASIAEPLARRGVSIMAVSTHDTDYLLVKSEAVSRAVSALEDAGHAVTRG